MPYAKLFIAISDPVSCGSLYPFWNSMFKHPILPATKEIERILGAALGQGKKDLPVKVAKF